MSRRKHHTKYMEKNNQNEHISLAEKIKKKREILSLDTVPVTQCPEVDTDDIFCIHRQKSLTVPDESYDGIVHANVKYGRSPGRDNKKLIKIRKSSIIDSNSIMYNNSDEENADDWGSIEQEYSTLQLSSASGSIRRSPSLINTTDIMHHWTNRESEDEDEISEEMEYMDPNVLREEHRIIEPTHKNSLFGSSKDHINKDHDDGLLPSDTYTTFEVDPSLEKKAISLFDVQQAVIEKPPPIDTAYKSKSFKKSLSNLFKKSCQDSKASAPVSPATSMLSLHETNDSEGDGIDKKSKKHFWSKKGRSYNKNTLPVPDCRKITRADLNAQESSGLSDDNISETSSLKSFSNTTSKQKGKASESLTKEKKQSKMNKIALVLKASRKLKSLSKKSFSEADLTKGKENCDTGYNNQSNADIKEPADLNIIRNEIGSKNVLTKIQNSMDSSNSQEETQDKKYLSEPNLCPKKKSKNVLFKIKALSLFQKSKKGNSGKNKGESDSFNVQEIDVIKDKIMVNDSEKFMNDIEIDKADDKDSSDESSDFDSSSKSSDSSLKTANLSQNIYESVKKQNMYSKEQRSSSVSSTCSSISKSLGGSPLNTRTGLKNNVFSVKTFDASSCSSSNNSLHKSTIDSKKSMKIVDSKALSSVNRSDESSHTDMSSIDEDIVVETDDSVSELQELSDCQKNPQREEASFDDLETLSLPEDKVSSSDSLVSEDLTNMCNSTREQSVEKEIHPSKDGKKKLQRAVFKLSTVKMLSKKKATDPPCSIKGQLSKLSMLNAWTLDGEANDIGSLDLDEQQDVVSGKAQKARAKLKNALLKYKVVKALKPTNEDINEVDDDQTKITSFNKSTDEICDIIDHRKDSVVSSTLDSINEDVSKDASSTATKKEAVKTKPSSKMKRALMKLRTVKQFSSLKKSQFVGSVSLPGFTDKDNTVADSNDDTGLNDNGVNNDGDTLHSAVKNNNVIHSIIRDDFSEYCEENDQVLDIASDELSLNNTSDNDNSESSNEDEYCDQSKISFKGIVFVIIAINRLKKKDKKQKSDFMLNIGKEQSQVKDSGNILKRTSSREKFKFWKKQSKSQLIDNDYECMINNSDSDLKNTTKDVNSDITESKNAEQMFTNKLPPLQKKSSFKKVFQKKSDNSIALKDNQEHPKKDKEAKNSKPNPAFPAVIGFVRWKKKSKKKKENDSKSVEASRSCIDGERICDNHEKGNKESSNKVLNDDIDNQCMKVTEEVPIDITFSSLPKKNEIEKCMEDEDKQTSVSHKACKLRLEQELEEARRKHEEEMKKQLEEAEKHMQTAVEKTKLEATQQLNMQKSEYEDRLQQLELRLKEQKSMKYESEQQKIQMEANVKKLEQQKLMLEQEVLANRKRLQLEAVAAQKAVSESRVEHSRIVEQLQKEKQKICAEVQRLEERRTRSKANTPRPATSDTNTSVTTPSTTPGNSSRKDLYRTALLVREANKIAQHLNKDTVFSREDVQEDGKATETVVKVTNCKLGISTFWSMDKFENRLEMMREMYRGESQDSEDVFYDPNDQWEKDDRLNCSPGISPVIIKNLRKQSQHSMSPRTPMKSRLSFDSVSTNSPEPRNSADTTQETMDLKSSTGDETCPPVMSLCRELISCSLDQHRPTSAMTQESVVDKMLHGADVIRGAVNAILDAYKMAEQDRNIGLSFPSNELVSGCSIQLSHGIYMLLSMCSVWRCQYSDIEESPAVLRLFDSLTACVRSMGNNMVLFLQGCENDISSMVDSSSSQLIDGVYQLIRDCGELALATGTSVYSLRDEDDTIIAAADCDTTTVGERRKLGHDIRQYFLSGCDHFVDKSLSGGLKAIDGFNTNIINITETTNDIVKSISDDVLKHVECTIASSRDLITKLQKVQVQLDSTIRESSSDSISSNFYHRNYVRCQSLITHVSNLTDGVSLLTQATETLVKDGDESCYRRLYRCAEMIQKSTLKILSASITSTSDSSILSYTSLSSSSYLSNTYSNNTTSDNDLSVLSDSQLEMIDVAAQEIKLSTNELILSVKRELDLDNKTLTRSPSKSKRMLPASPKRSNSFKGSPTKGKVKRMAALVDLAAKSST